MARKFAKNAIFSIVALVAIFVFNFFLPRLMPGDPLDNLIGSDDTVMTQEEYDELYSKMGLDKPLGEQFGLYVKNLFKGEWGYSYHLGCDVGGVIGEKITRTIQIALPAWLFSALLAYWLGLLAGSKKSQFTDVGLSSAMVLVDAIPNFLMAIMLLILFAFKWHILPSGALNSIGKSGFGDRLLHLILPVFTLTLVSTPKKYLLVRNQAASVCENRYVVYARAKGLQGARIRNTHIFPNISAPFISMLGTSFGHMIAGSIVIEKIFSIDGVGMLVNEAINNKDFPVLQGALLVIALSVIISNFIADAISTIDDPSQRRRG